MNFTLIETEFKHVRLGEVFFDPELSLRMQKIDEPQMNGRNIENRYNNEHNAQGDGAFKNFKPNDIVKRAKFKTQES